MKRRWLTVIVLTMTIALAASTIILAFLNRKAPDIWAIFEPLTWAGAVVASCVGVLLATRRPRNGVGWVLLVIGLTGQTASLFTLWGIYGLETNPDVSGGARALWTGLWLSTIGFAGAPGLLILLFPDGRLRSKFSRIIAGGALLGTIMITLGLMTGTSAPPNFPVLYERTLNPYALDQPLVDPFIGIATIGVCSVLAVALLLRRFVKSQGVEREQYKWVVLAMSGTVVAFFLDTLVRASGNSAISLTGFLLSLSVAFVPVAMAIAILHYHLFDIDRVINRTLVYGALTVGLVASYTLIVILSQALLDPLFRSGDLQIAVSTLIVATLFQPLRARIQRMVDRRFNRARYDATQTVAAFVGDLRDEVDLDDIERNLQTIVIRTMQPTHVSLWIRPE